MDAVGYKTEQPPRLDIDEIRRLYPDQYVILDDLILADESLEVRAGRVISCGPTKREVFAHVPSLAGKSWALRFSGEIKPPPLWMGGIGIR
jgi:hypothetical protein